MTTTETLKYDFGTTPEEVIRERLAAWQETADAQTCHPILHRNTDPDDLITVLDNVVAVYGAYLSGRQGFTVQRATRARHLRIDILASLGIKEG